MHLSNKVKLLLIGAKVSKLETIIRIFEVTAIIATTKLAYMLVIIIDKKITRTLTSLNFIDYRYLII